MLASRLPPFNDLTLQNGESLGNVGLIAIVEITTLFAASRD
jgi:hypothetical protein